MGNGKAAVSPPHVLIFPLPFQGPVNCMLKLAQLLCLDTIKVTFLNTQHIHQRLLNCTEIYSKTYPNIGFETIPDGLPDANPRTADRIVELLESIEAVSLPILRQMLTSGVYGPHSQTPVSCLIVDGVFPFATDLAKLIGVPLIYFNTVSPSAQWSYLCLPKLIQAGEIPFKDENLDELIRNAPGMEGVIRRRDLPSFCRANDLNDRAIQLLLETRLAGRVQATASYSPWEEDKSCISWLDKQPFKSVIYVSIGSLAVMTKHQLFEIWHGLVDSGSRFLWVRRPGSVTGFDPESDEIPMELSQGTKERGCIVSWAPQQAVLAHPAVGGFFTHAGWNSTLESIVEGTPMICWPSHADQQVNSRYVQHVWKIGLDIKDSCDRVLFKNTILELMESRKDEFLQRTQETAKLAKLSVTQGGSGMEGIIRRRDLPSFCRTKDLNDPIIQLILKEDKHIRLAQGLIFNTFQELEAPILSQMLNICPNIYSIGPLQAHLKSRLEAETGPGIQPINSSSIWKEDKSCISWLHQQPSNSVIYVSIGSLAVLTKDQFFEVWHGLVDSGSRFLWVRRPGSVVGLDLEPDQIPMELSIGTKERGCIVSWAPQEEVLAHPEIGCFLTHSGWNSTLECIVEGKPMVCWPYFVDQQVNSRYVGHVWKLGLDMKDTCDRVTIKEMIREVMDLRKDEFLKRGQEMAKLANSGVTKGGSSFQDFDRLIQDIKMMKIPMK